jgi:arylformamidase
MLDAFIQSLGRRNCRVIDLSHTLGPGIPVYPGFPDPGAEVMYSQAAGKDANVEKLQFVPHSGTHMDAPYHFFSDLRRVDELPVDCLIGPAVVVDLSAKKGSVAIAAEDIRRWEHSTGEAIAAGDIVLLRTDHSKNWKVGPDAGQFWKNGWPYLAASAVDYLAGKPIKALGVETFSPDPEFQTNPGLDTYYTHHTLLPKGILIMECLANLDQVPTRRGLLIALPLKIAGGSGSPLRVVMVVEE